MSLYSQRIVRAEGRGVISEDTIIRRGNLSVLATAEFRRGQIVSTPAAKPRYVWPSPYSQNSTGILSRKVFIR